MASGTMRRVKRALEFDKRLESIFCLLMVLEESSLQEVVKMLEEAVVSLQEFW